MTCTGSECMTGIERRFVDASQALITVKGRSHRKHVHRTRHIDSRPSRPSQCQALAVLFLAMSASCQCLAKPPKPPHLALSASLSENPLGPLVDAVLLPHEGVALEPPRWSCPRRSKVHLVSSARDFYALQEASYSS